MTKQTSWRHAWLIDEARDAVPTAPHETGLRFQIEYDDIHWVFWSADAAEIREKQLRQEMGDAAFDEFKDKLYRELRLLWRERGFTNFSPFKGDLAAPWRAEWALHTHPGATAHAVHTSGLA